MGEIEEVTVSKGLTKQTGEKEWLKVEYSVKARVDSAGEVVVAKSELETLVDAWLHEAFHAGEKKQQPVEQVKPEISWDPQKMKWQPAEGSSGAYERSEDTNNPEFKAMLKDLAAHGGKMTRDSYFYWVFKNGSTVGRKKRQA